MIILLKQKTTMPSQGMVAGGDRLPINSRDDL